MQISVFHCSQVGQKKDEHLSIPSNQLCRQLRESVTGQALSIRFAYGPCFGPTVCHSFLFHPFIRTLGISKAHMHIGHNLDLICMLNRNITRWSVRRRVGFCSDPFYVYTSSPNHVDRQRMTQLPYFFLISAPGAFEIEI